MAIEWCIQQATSDLYWKKLHEVLLRISQILFFLLFLLIIFICKQIYDSYAHRDSRTLKVGLIFTI